MTVTEPIFIRTESTFQYALVGLFLFFVSIGFMFFNVFLGLAVLIIAVNVFLSRQKTEIDPVLGDIIRTIYPLFFPMRSTESIAGCNRIAIYYERSTTSKGGPLYLRVAIRSEYYEIQFRSNYGKPISLIEFPDHKSTAELANKLSQWLNLPVDDLYLQWMEQTRENREKRRRAGIR